MIAKDIRNGDKIVHPATGVIVRVDIVHMDDTLHVAYCYFSDRTPGNDAFPLGYTCPVTKI